MGLTVGLVVEEVLFSNFSCRLIWSFLVLDTCFWPNQPAFGGQGRRFEWYDRKKKLRKLWAAQVI